jgi:3',5'-cyclic AMP phosphodiesterase CpdA
MARIYQHPDPELSLLQSAIDQVAIQQKAGGAQSLGEAIANNDRPGVDDPMVFQAAALAADISSMRAAGQTYLQPGVPPGAAAEGIAEGAKYCISLAYNYAKAKLKGDAATAQQCWADLHAPFGSCDPRYAQAATDAAGYFIAAQGKIPYVPWKSISDFVIDDGSSLPANAVVAVVGDWGTGQPEALAVLEAVAARNPDVVIHLGDVYYAGTDPEEQNYFFDNWRKILNLTCDANRKVTSPRPKTFSLPGNHDMYCGGQPYYKMIEQLGQDASFFCLRNQYWQFIGLDTGYYDHSVVGPCTHLAPGQPEWLADKMVNNGKRKTLLLSHHQLFSNSETFDPMNGTPASSTNPLLMAEVGNVLSRVNLWLWGHQHQFVAYADPRVKARCIGHGAYPVGISEIGQVSPTIPLDATIVPQQHGGDFWDQGYALIQLNGPSATVTYYAIDDTGNERSGPSSETI